VRIQVSQFLLGSAGCLLALPVWLAGQQAPDLVLYNGKILTVDKNFSIAQAVAVSENRISLVGTDQQVLAQVGPQTQKIDLKGRTVTPGLIDTHRHVYSFAEADYGGLVSGERLHRYWVDWRGVKTKEDILARVQQIMENGKFDPGRWVYLINQVSFSNDQGSPYEVAKILYDGLDQWKLDRVTPDNPVLMSLGIPDVNAILANKKAMDWLMSAHGDFVRQNGRYWVDDDGRPDGHLEPPASRILLPFVYDREAPVLGAIYRRHMEEAISMGMTAVSTRLPQDALAAYQWLEQQGQMAFRVGYGAMEAFGNVDLDQEGLKAYAAQIGTGTDKIWLVSVSPMAIDGTGSRQCTSQPRAGNYTPIDSWFPVGQCHTDGEYRGAARRAAPIEKNYFADWVLASGRDGVRFANTHVAGDRATSLMLNLAEQLQKQHGPEATKNWALDHCGMIDPRDFPRLAKLKITVSCYVMVSVNEAAAMARAYGEEVAHSFPSPLQSLVDAGVRVVLESGSDSYLWQDLRAAITRKDPSGKVWGPQDRVDRPTALRMLTSWAAEYVLKGNQLGSIEAGKFADLLVLDKDYLTIPEDDIGGIQPQLTLFDGKIVFVHQKFAEEYDLHPEGALVSTYPDLVRARARRASGGLGG
jgi:predicted amidohydrolase YtcJ